MLLVILESVSGNYLETASQAHGREAVNRMPNLDAAFAEGIEGTLDVEGAAGNEQTRGSLFAGIRIRF